MGGEQKRRRTNPWNVQRPPEKGEGGNQLGRLTRKAARGDERTYSRGVVSEEFEVREIVEGRTEWRKKKEAGERGSAPDASRVSRLVLNVQEIRQEETDEVDPHIRD